MIDFAISLSRLIDANEGRSEVAIDDDPEVDCGRSGT
jgi:hypothetical protein